MRGGDKEIADGAFFDLSLQRTRRIKVVGQLDLGMCGLIAFGERFKRFGHAGGGKYDDLGSDGGLFIFDAITEHHLADTLSDNIFYEDYDDFTLLWVNSFDEETKFNTAELTLFALTEEGLYDRFDGELVEKFYPAEFFVNAGEKAGLSLLAVYGELKDNDPSEDEERIFYVFGKKA